MPDYDQTSSCPPFIHSSSEYIDLNEPSEEGSASYARECATVYIGGFSETPSYIYKINITTDEIISKEIPRKAYRMVLANDYIWTSGPDISFDGCYLQKIDKNTLESVWEDNQAFDNVRALIFDGTYIWGADRGENKKLHRINPVTNEIDSYTGIVQPGARHMCFDGTYIWISCNVNSTVVRVNPLDPIHDHNVIKNINGAWGICYDGSSIIVAGAGGDIYKIDPATTTVTMHNSISGCNWLCDANYDGTYVWIVDNNKNNVRIIDPVDLTLVDTKETLTMPGKSHYDGMHHWILHENKIRILKLML